MSDQFDSDGRLPEQTHTVQRNTGTCTVTVNAPRFALIFFDNQDSINSVESTETWPTRVAAVDRIVRDVESYLYLYILRYPANRYLVPLPYTFQMLTPLCLNPLSPVLQHGSNVLADLHRTDAVLLFARLNISQIAEIDRKILGIDPRSLN